MTVEVERFLSSGDFVPFHQKVRGGVEGAVGSLACDFEATGDGSGGSVWINVSAADIEFGFRYLFVPTFVFTRDTLASAANISFGWVGTSNRRLQVLESYAQTLVAIAASGVNHAKADPSGIVIEGRTRAQGRIMRIAWPTNTNTFVYHVHVFGTMFDAELIEKQGSIHSLLTGIR